MMIITMIMVHDCNHLYNFFPEYQLTHLYHVSEKYLMAVIVGTIGGVAVIAFIIAAVRYVGQNNKK